MHLCEYSVTVEVDDFVGGIRVRSKGSGAAQCRTAGRGLRVGAQPVRAHAIGLHALSERACGKPAKAKPAERKLSPTSAGGFANHEPHTSAFDLNVNGAAGAT